MKKFRLLGLGFRVGEFFLNFLIFFNVQRVFQKA